MSRVTDDQIARVPGWLSPLDVALMRLLLTESAAQGSGDLAELGVYQGKSAIVIGESLGPGETFTVVDLFEDEAIGSENRREIAEQFGGLSQRLFEHHYREVHGDLPVVVKGPSHTIAEHASDGTHRLVHIDASHLYEPVVKDLEVARVLLRSSGVVVLDEYREAHTPGVAAAAWLAVGEGLKPFALSELKMYATWGDAVPWVDLCRRWAASSRVLWEEQVVAENEIVRVWQEERLAHPFVPPAVLSGLRRGRDAHRDRAARKRGLT